MSNTKHVFSDCCVPVKVTFPLSGQKAEFLSYSTQGTLSKRQKCSYVFLREGESSCIP